MQEFETFWESFGRYIKVGVIEDEANRVDLAKLMRFASSTSGDKLTSLTDYVSRMKEDQKQIYFLIGECDDDGGTFLCKFRSRQHVDPSVGVCTEAASRGAESSRDPRRSGRSSACVTGRCAADQMRDLNCLGPHPPTATILLQHPTRSLPSSRLTSKAWCV